jgi:hypothetical protein
LVERRQLRLLQARYHREHGGIDESDVCIGVRTAELADPKVVHGPQLFYVIGAGRTSSSNARRTPGWRGVLIQ